MHTRKMPFGAYKGVAMADLPDGYIEWLTSLGDLRDPLREWIRAERKRRFGEREDANEDDLDDADRDRAGPAFALRPEELPMLADLVEAGYRALALTWHPDMGGSTARMQRLNVLVDSLRRQLKGRRALAH